MTRRSCNWLLAGLSVAALLLVARPALAQTATPSPTPTLTPTATATPSPVAGVGFYEVESYAQIVQSGSWSPVSDADYFGGAGLSSADGSLYWWVQGDRVTLFVERLSGGGDFEVCIDGLACQQVSTDGAAEYRYAVPVVAGPGVHRVYVNALDTGTVYLDAFAVDNAGAAPLVGAGSDPVGAVYTLTVLGVFIIAYLLMRLFGETTQLFFLFTVLFVVAGWLVKSYETSGTVFVFWLFSALIWQFFKFMYQTFKVA